MNPYEKYQDIQVKTADKGRLILMMYDGAIIFLQQARELYKEKDYIGKTQKISRTQDIIFELIAALNMEAGSIAKNLKSLYMYMIKRLFDANMKKDLAAIEESIKILSELRIAWEKITTKPEGMSIKDIQQRSLSQARMVQL
ncbi:MAG: flagellar export chaperone FliS [Nitrospira sp.]|nr:flagellar export chaperone FliS [Nitrospira sp.]